jgi:hypothetical protein
VSRGALLGFVICRAHSEFDQGFECFAAESTFPTSALKQSLSRVRELSLGDSEME